MRKVKGQTMMGLPPDMKYRVGYLVMFWSEQYTSKKVNAFQAATNLTRDTGLPRFVSELVIASLEPKRYK